MEKSEEKTEEKTFSDTAKSSLNYQNKSVGNIEITEDERIAKLVKKIGEKEEDGKRKIMGYRVQVFFDKSKDNINREKNKFKLRYGNSIGCYVEYKAPNYRIKVGNFRTEIDAERYKQSILGVFPTAFVVNEKILLPTINLNSGDEN